MNHGTRYGAEQKSKQNSGTAQQQSRCLNVLACMRVLA